MQNMAVLSLESNCSLVLNNKHPPAAVQNNAKVGANATAPIAASRCGSCSCVAKCTGFHLVAVCANVKLPLWLQ